MKRTFSIDKTNPRLTGNIKCVVDSRNRIFLESIDSSEYLSQSHYKGFEFNPNLSWGSNLRNFASKWNNTDEVYETVDEVNIDKNNNINTTYHQLYHRGVRSSGNAMIDGKFRYFAPLHIGMVAEEHPDAFIIYGIPETPSKEYDYGSKYTDWINKGKILKIFDLGKVKKQIFGGVTDSYVQFDFSEDVSAVGVSLSSGLEKRAHETNGDEFLENEVTITEWENNITNIYKRHNMVYGNIVNLEFAFDDVGDNSFKRYVGFYVKYNKVGFDVIKDFEGTGAIRLINTQDGIRQFKNTDAEQTYSTVTRNTKGSTVGMYKPSILQFKLMLNPNIGEHLYIKNKDDVEHDVIFDNKTIGSTISETSNNIVDQINTKYQGNHSSISARYRDGWITLTSNSTVVEFDDDLNISGESYVRIKQPVWNINGATNNKLFTLSNKKTILLNEFINPDQFGGYIQYRDDFGIIHDAKILKVETNGDYFLYQMETNINKKSEPSTFWFVAMEGGQPLLCSILDHRELDVRQTVSEYEDVYDFSVTEFKDYLINRVSKRKEVGGILSYNGYDDYSQVSAEDLVAYNMELEKNILAYFQDLNVDPKSLIRNIDLDTSDSKLTENEYSRLGEYINENLNQINRLYPIVNKWSLCNGNDVYNNPYRLNLSLPFGIDNYSTNQKMDRRDIRFYTHSWYVLGDGIPPYIGAGDRKRLSYSKQPINENLLMDNDIDAYTLLEHNTGGGMQHAYTEIEYDPIQEKSFAFFRGLKWFFEDNTLNKYKFSVILSGSRHIEDRQFDMEFVKNDAHKTMTLLIWFYIPDPILTSLESGQSGYTLDRSLMYYSNQVLSTSQETFGLGEARISLNLYDVNEPKRYLDVHVGTSWVHKKLNDNESIIWVGRGDRKVFNTPFSSLMELNDTFIIHFTESDDINSPYYGMYIEFVEIVEVGTDHFWCKEIVIRNNTNYDPENDNDHDLSDNLVDNVYEHRVLKMFLADNNVFQTNNTIYSSKGIASENCSYTKSITTETNNTRYKEITIPNIKNYLASNPIGIYRSNRKILVGVVDTISNDISVTLDYDFDRGITLLTEPYVFPIHRYNGVYKPQTKLLYRATDSELVKNVWISSYTNPIYERLSILPKPSDVIPRTTEYEQIDIHYKHPEAYPFFTQVGGDTYSTKSIGWIYNPVEHVGEPSLVFNGVTTLEFVSKEREIELSDLMFTRVKRWLKLDTIKLDPEQNLNFMNISTKVYVDTLGNYDIQKYIVQNFIKNTFIEQYHIKEVVDRLGSKMNFVLDDMKLIIDDDLGGNEYTISFVK